MLLSAHLMPSLTRADTANSGALSVIGLPHENR